MKETLRRITVTSSLNEISTDQQGDYNSPYFIVNSVVGYKPQLQRGRGGVGKISPVG